MSALVLVGVASRVAHAQDAGGLLVSYFDVATASFPSASGYGGSGSSGGAGDSLLRVVNPTHFDTTQNGTLCAMIYVLDDVEELQECCGCLVTPDGMRTLSVINDLSGNRAISGANLNAGVVDVISAPPNFEESGPGAQIPPGISVTPVGSGCDPSGTFGSTSGAGTSTPISPEPGLRAWLSHLETLSPIPSSANFPKGLSVEPLSDALIDSAHLSQLQSFCNFIMADGSGHGICGCGSGDGWSI